jgi:hypothetical protein
VVAQLAPRDSKRQSDERNLSNSVKTGVITIGELFGFSVTFLQSASRTLRALSKTTFGGFQP